LRGGEDMRQGRALSGWFLALVRENVLPVLMCCYIANVFDFPS
jgi:hypothetical protein